MGVFPLPIIRKAQDLFEMKRLPSLLLKCALVYIALPLASVASAQQTAEQMNCAQAVAYFASNGVIYKSVHGTVLPISMGIPVGARKQHQCLGRGKSWRNYTMKTLDIPRCAVILVCD
jgi:hypothetical protein